MKNEYVDDSDESKTIKVTCEDCGDHKKLWSVGDKLLDEFRHICYNCKMEKDK